MVKKVILNILYNISILTLILCIFYLFNHEHYALLLGAVFVLSILIYLKIRLIRSVRAMSRQK